MKNDELHPQFRIRAPLRCDGIGRLDCAEDTESGARLAVRWLPLEANGDAAVRACAQLPEHPTLPRVRQTGQVGDKAFVAMEFPDGQLLSTLSGEPVAAELLLELGGQLADALATVHAQLVVHGEMSAESVLLAKGKAYLWDMPLVIANRLTDRRGEERLMHQLVRTAPFLSPERARGGGPTPECDVYALAAVMCLAAGARPPPIGTTLSVVHAVVTGEWAPVVPAVFSKSVHGLLSRMLAREAAKRPTAREAADLLLGRSTTTVPTIPELPVVVVPPSNPVLVPVPALRPAPKSAFAAAPGALEPTLPPRALAEKARKQPSRPLAVTVPSQVEPTLKVTLPGQSGPAVSIDAAVMAAAEAFERGLSAGSPKGTLEGAARAWGERKTTPAQAPRASELNDALEAPAITAPNPPPVSRKANHEAPPAADETQGSVELQDNVSVSAETFAAGAEVLVPRRWKPPFMIAAAVLAVLTLGLALGVRALVSHPNRESVALQPTGPVPAPKVVEPSSDTTVEVQDVEVDQEDELSALPPAVPRLHPARPPPHKAAPPPSKLQGKYDPSAETAPADDFSVVSNGGTDAPKEDLKRPSF
jgi:serine/threonine protein kinase